MTIGPPEVINSVWPSAGDLAAYSLPMLPPAPPRLSMRKVLPNISLSPLAVGRATMSDGPPGGQGTTIVTFLPGQLCAAANEHANTPSIPAKSLTPRSIVIASVSSSDCGGISPGPRKARRLDTARPRSFARRLFRPQGRRAERRRAGQ
ncbi:MAG: hypothetical protein QM701_11860 [Propionivibrio sp.]